MGGDGSEAGQGWVGIEIIYVEKVGDGCNFCPYAGLYSHTVHASPTGAHGHWPKEGKGAHAPAAGYNTIYLTFYMIIVRFVKPWALHKETSMSLLVFV